MITHSYMQMYQKYGHGRKNKKIQNRKGTWSSSASSHHFDIHANDKECLNFIPSHLHRRSFQFDIQLRYSTDLLLLGTFIVDTFHEWQ